METHAVSIKTFFEMLEEAFDYLNQDMHNSIILGTCPQTSQPMLTKCSLGKPHTIYIALSEPDVNDLEALAPQGIRVAHQLIDKFGDMLECLKVSQSSDCN